MKHIHFDRHEARQWPGNGSQWPGNGKRAIVVTLKSEGQRAFCRPLPCERKGCRS